MPETDEDLREEILSALEIELERQANMDAALAWSTPGDELIDRYGDVWVLADFDGHVAVNQELVGEDEDVPEPPEGYELSDEGGEIPTTEEAVALGAVVAEVARQTGAPRAEVERVAREEGYGEMVSVSVSGEAEVYVPE